MTTFETGTDLGGIITAGLPSPPVVPSTVVDAQPDDPTVGAPVAAEHPPADDDVEEEPEA